MPPDSVFNFGRSSFFFSILVVLTLLLPGASHGQAVSAAAYCDLMSRSCIEEVIHDEDFCLAFMADALPNVMTAGTLGETGVNSLGCRIGYALEAETAQAAGDEAARQAACSKAALTGGDVCGRYCENYCDLAIATCNTDNNPAYMGTPLFMSGGSPSRAACEAICAGYSEDVLDGISQSDQLFGYGDTVQCRIHHLQAAIVDGGENASAYGLHCGHASPAAEQDLCSDVAEPNVINYCVFALRHCEGDEALLASGYEHSDCVNFMNSVVASGDYTAEGFESFADSGTNSIGCLNNRIMLAAIDSAQYCAEGDWDSSQWWPAGGAVCRAAAAVPGMAEGARWGLALILLALGISAFGLLGLSVARSQ